MEKLDRLILDCIDSAHTHTKSSRHYQLFHVKKQTLTRLCNLDLVCVTEVLFYLGGQLSPLKVLAGVLEGCCFILVL